MRETRDSDSPAASRPATRAPLGVTAVVLVVAAVAAHALSGESAAPRRAPSPADPAADLQALLERVLEDCSPQGGGAVADYIPALREADPERFGIAIVTVDGRLYSVGDATVPFALMSAAKPFTAALVLEQVGTEALVDKIGVEPTGEPFNSVLAIEQDAQRSINPLVNAGAIAAVSLLQPTETEARWSRLSGFFDALAGEELELLDDVLASVSASNHRNRAIANLLYSYDRLYSEPSEALEVYNRQSCLAVTTEQLAWMGACLAAGGVQPRTGERVFAAEHTDEILSLMCLSGFYDESGAWAYRVGLPAKSGVGGGIVAIAPGRLAIAAFSPRLNSSGNSVRASAAIAQLADELELSLFRPPHDND